MIKCNKDGTEIKQNTTKRKLIVIKRSGSNGGDVIKQLMHKCIREGKNKGKNEHAHPEKIVLAITLEKIDTSK